MISRISPEMAERLVSTIAERCVYVSLHSAEPSFSAPSATELSYGGYTRQLIQWQDLITGGRISIGSIVFTGLKPPVTIAAVGLNRTSNTSELVAYGMLPDIVTSGKTSFRLEEDIIVRIV